MTNSNGNIFMAGGRGLPSFGEVRDGITERLSVMSNGMRVTVAYQTLDHERQRWVDEASITCITEDQALALGEVLVGLFKPATLSSFHGGNSHE
jgi:hypothetical protein